MTEEPKIKAICKKCNVIGEGKDLAEARKNIRCKTDTSAFGIATQHLQYLAIHEPEQIDVYELVQKVPNNYDGSKKSLKDSEKSESKEDNSSNKNKKDSSTTKSNQTTKETK